VESDVEPSICRRRRRTIICIVSGPALVAVGVAEAAPPWAAAVWTRTACGALPSAGSRESDAWRCTLPNARGAVADPVSSNAAKTNGGTSCRTIERHWSAVIGVLVSWDAEPPFSSWMGASATTRCSAPGAAARTSSRRLTCVIYPACSRCTM
jgi:hypothetical protein